jgi:O-antigen ligase
MPVPSGIPSSQQNPVRDRLPRATYYLAFGSAATILFSISVSQILLGLALASLLVSGERIRLPPVRLPLACFFALTVISLLASGDPLAGLPQIRKFFVFATVAVVYNSFQTVRQIESLVLAWAGAGSLSAMLGIGQFIQRRQAGLELHADSYGYLLDGRITGFASHWMTFGGEEMIVLLMLVSLLFFSNRRKAKLFVVAPILLIWASITLSMTRCIFLLGVPAGMAYLLWRRKGSLLLALPVVAAVGFAAAPTAIHERILSVFHPHGEVDSNSHRAVCRAVGWEMIKAHPWLGLGPEQVGKQFQRYLPARVRRPLPQGWYGHLHNIYFQYAAERGIPALLCMLWFIGKCLLDFLRRLNCNSKSIGPPERSVLHGAIAVVIAILAEGLFEHNLGDSEVLTMFLAVVACGYVVADRPWAGNSTEERGGADAQQSRASIVA